jgi:hypothetical protein
MALESTAWPILANSPQLDPYPGTSLEDENPRGSNGHQTAQEKTADDFARTSDLPAAAKALNSPPNRRAASPAFVFQRSPATQIATLQRTG